jgi:hypothetical protein
VRWTRRHVHQPDGHDPESVPGLTRRDAQPARTFDTVTMVDCPPADQQGLRTTRAVAAWCAGITAVGLAVAAAIAGVAHDDPRSASRLPAPATTSETLDPAFLTRVGAVCSHALADQASHPFPLRNLDTSRLTSANLPKVANYRQQYRGDLAVKRELVAIGEPSVHRHAWDDLRSALEQEVTNVIDQLRQRQARNLTGFEKTLDPADSLQHQIKTLAEQLGLTTTAPCRDYYR